MKYYRTCLSHHGIMGQKWGVRRYQNKDGTLTPEGRRHYNIQEINRMGEISRKMRKEADQDEIDAAYALSNYSDVKKNGANSEAALDFITSWFGVSTMEEVNKYYNSEMDKAEIDLLLEDLSDLYLEDFKNTSTDAGMKRKFANKLDKEIAIRSKDLNKEYNKFEDDIDNGKYDISDEEGFDYYSKIRGY